MWLLLQCGTCGMTHIDPKVEHPPSVRRAADTWTSIAPLAKARSGPSCCWMDGKLYAIGGALHRDGGCRNGFVFQDFVDSAEVREKPKKLRHDVLPPLSYLVLDHLCGPPARVSCDALLAVPVLRRAFLRHDVMADSHLQVYDMATKAWGTAPAFGRVRRYNGQVFCRGDLLFFLGGTRQETPPVSPCMMYDPADATWHSLPTPLAARGSASYGIVGDKVVMVGGEGVVANTSELLTLPKLVGQPVAYAATAAAHGVVPFQAAVLAAPASAPAAAPPALGSDDAPVRTSVSVHVPQPDEQQGGVLSAVRTMQLSHEWGTVPDCDDLAQLYAETAEAFGVAASKIMYCTRNTPHLDMEMVVLPGDPIGNDDAFFAHMIGPSREVAVPELDMARIEPGLQLAENGAGLIFIRGCVDGNVDGSTRIRPGDQLVAINGVATTGTSCDAVVVALRVACAEGVASLTLVSPKAAADPSDAAAAPVPAVPSDTSGTRIALHTANDVQRVQDCDDLAQLYAETAEAFGVASSKIMYCTRNTPHVDMAALVLSSDPIGSDDMFFAHLAGATTEVKLAVGSAPLGLTTTMVGIGTGRMIILGCKSGSAAALSSGISAGDQLVAVDGEPVDVPAKLSTRLKAAAGSVITLTLVSPKPPRSRSPSPSRQARVAGAPTSAVARADDSVAGGASAFVATHPVVVVAGAVGKLPGGIDYGEKCNGRYAAVRVLNGKPLFKKVGGEAIVFFAGFWKLNHTDAFGGWVFGRSDAKGPLPPDGAWRHDGFPVQSWHPDASAAQCPILSCIPGDSSPPRTETPGVASAETAAEIAQKSSSSGPGLGKLSLASARGGVAETPVASGQAPSSGAEGATDSKA